MNNLIDKFKKILDLLNSKQKKKLILLFIIYIFSIFFDIIGIGMVIPILNLVVSGELNQTLADYISYDIDNIPKENLIFYSISFFFLFYIFKTIFGTFALWYDKKFIYGLQADFSVNLLNKYMSEDYLNYLNKNYSDLVRNIVFETSVFVSGVIHGGIALLTEILIVIGVAILLILYDPLGSSFIIISVLSIVVIYVLIFKKKLRNLGVERQKLESIILDQISKAFQLFKEIRISMKEKKNLNNFRILIERKNQIAIFEDLVNGLPKLYFELVCVFLITLVILINLFMQNDFSNIVPTLGLYAAAFFKIFPSFNRIIGNTNSLIHNYVSYELISNDLQPKNFLSKEKNINDYPKFKNYLLDLVNTNKIELLNFSFSFDKSGNRIQIFKDCNLSLNKGEITGILGESGSGKSTLANILSGLIKVEEGKFKVGGNNNFNLNLLPSLVSYVPQMTNLFNDTIINNICFGDNNIEERNQKIEKIVDFLNLQPMLDKMPGGLNTIIKEQGQILSGGQRQKIALARTLYMGRKIIIFDESTSYLDKDNEIDFMEAISKIKNDKIIIFISHNENLNKYFDKIYRLKNYKMNLEKENEN